MLAVAGILIASMIMILIEVPSLLRKKLKKELWAFSILLSIGTALSIAHSLRVKLPNPLDWIYAVFGPVTDAVLSFLK